MSIFMFVVLCVSISRSCPDFVQMWNRTRETSSCPCSALGARHDWWRETTSWIHWRRTYVHVFAALLRNDPWPEILSSDKSCFLKLNSPKGSHASLCHLHIKEQWSANPLWQWLLFLSFSLKRYLISAKLDFYNVLNHTKWSNGNSSRQYFDNIY